MKRLLKLSVAPAAFAALAFVAMATPAAAAGPNAAGPNKGTDYCRTDTTSGMRGCGYTSLEQCHDMSSGRGGDCYANPFPSNANAGGNALAFQPKSRAHRTRQPVGN